jgi:ParB family chromosome partitioning protein
MTEAEGRNTWRTDRYSPCPREDASRYLTFLASLGYELSVIEQTVADGVPFTGDPPQREDSLSEDGPAEPPSTDPAPGPADDDGADDADDDGVEDPADPDDPDVEDPGDPDAGETA